MLRNRKGFVIEGAAVIWTVVSLVVGAITLFKGPEIVKSVGTLVNGGDKNQTKQTLKVSESYPVGHLDAKGNFVKIGDYKKSEDRLNLVAEKPKETLWEKFLHLGWMAVIIIGLISAGITYLGGWGIVGGWIKKLKDKITTLESSHEDLKYEATKIVMSVKSGLDTLDEANKTKFMDAMSKVQDSSTKDLVKELLKQG